MLIFGRLSTMTDRRNPLTFRCAVPDDEVFLFELYASTRNEEMAAWGWDRAQEQMFLNLQFTAQRRHYDIAFPNAEHKIILLDDRPIGRILVFRTEREIRLVDIALLREYRGGGIGASLVRGLFEEAMAANKPVTLHVAKLSRAVRFYRRLGFSIIGDTGTDHKMEWRPDKGSTERRLPI
jgi:ribosomal protein S18 acetylase RimI-like enzyme